MQTTCPNNHQNSFCCKHCKLSRQSKQPKQSIIYSVWGKRGQKEANPKKLTQEIKVSQHSNQSLHTSQNPNNHNCQSFQQLSFKSALQTCRQTHRHTHIHTHRQRERERERERKKEVRDMHTSFFATGNFP